MVEPADDHKVCPKCQGKGFVPDPDKPGQHKPCVACLGTGKAGGYFTKGT